MSSESSGGGSKGGRVAMNEGSSISNIKHAPQDALSAVASSMLALQDSDTNLNHDHARGNEGRDAGHTGREEEHITATSSTPQSSTMQLDDSIHAASTAVLNEPQLHQERDSISSLTTAQEGAGHNDTDSIIPYASTSDTVVNLPAAAAAAASMARILEGIEDGTATTTATSTGLRVTDSTRVGKEEEQRQQLEETKDMDNASLRESTSKSLLTGADFSPALSSGPSAPLPSSSQRRPGSSAELHPKLHGQDSASSTRALQEQIPNDAITSPSSSSSIPPIRPARSSQRLSSEARTDSREQLNGIDNNDIDYESETTRPDTTTTTSSSTPTPQLNVPSSAGSNQKGSTSSITASQASSSQHQLAPVAYSSSSSTQAKKSNASSYKSSRSDRDVFKTPELPSPSLPSLNGSTGSGSGRQPGLAYNAPSNSAPNLQQQQQGSSLNGPLNGQAHSQQHPLQQQQRQHDVTPYRYSHAAYSSTHPPVTASSHALQPQRSSAPILAAIALPPHSYSQSQQQIQPHQGGQPQHPDLIFTSSPVNIGIGSGNDAGFGSSSPYPPIGGTSSQQRYSLPLQNSSSSASNNNNMITTYLPTSSSAGGSPQAQLHHEALLSQSPPSNIVGTSVTSLRPQPTMNYSSTNNNGRDSKYRHLPEMHPSALEARPSNSAPFPPSSSPPPRHSKSLTKPPSSSSQQQQQQQQVTLAANTLSIAAPAAIQQRERPDASRPLGQEICLECLMRDRDMADVEVTGPGVWSRTSDIDFEEALRAEELAITAYANSSNGVYGSGGGGGSVEDGPFAMNGAGGGNNSTDENFPTINGRSQAQQQQQQMRSPSSRESSVSDAGSRGFSANGAGAGARRRINNNGQYQSGGHQQHMMRKKLGVYDPLTSASLKLWTQINHVSSSHRYKVLQDFVHEQIRFLDMERRAYEQSLLDRERNVDARSSISSGTGAAAANAIGTPSPKLLDLRRLSKGRQSQSSSSYQQQQQQETALHLPNGLPIENIDVDQWEEKEARARTKTAAAGASNNGGKGRRASASSSPADQRKSYAAPSIKSVNAFMQGSSSKQQQDHDSLPSPTGSFAPPWMMDERRRFSSPMLTSKFRNASTDNLSTVRQGRPGATAGYGSGDNNSNADLRMSSHSMYMMPPVRAMRSPSPSRQSFQTATSQRDSRGWRKSLWPRSASASVASFPRSGSMMEMHLGMSQDKHYAMPSSGVDGSYPPHMDPRYPHHSYNTGPNGSVMHAPGATWPDNASELGEQAGGISPDENVEAAKSKHKKKKRFQKLFNSLLGTHHHQHPDKLIARKSAEPDQYATAAQIPYDQQGSASPHMPQYQQQQQQGRPQSQSQQRRQPSFNYAAAAYQDDYSEPLAPPPPLSYLTGQQPHSRSYSTSSQSSISPVIPNSSDHQNSMYQSNTRPSSLAVPKNYANNSSSSGFISPSTSSSDLNRPRPSSVTSWRSSSNKTTGSPQSPRELLVDNFSGSGANAGGGPYAHHYSSQQQYHPGMPAIRQDSMEEIVPGVRISAGIEMIKEIDPMEMYKLRREKSLPALPPGEIDEGHPPMPGQDYALQNHLPYVSYGRQAPNHQQQQSPPFPNGALDNRSSTASMGMSPRTLTNSPQGLSQNEAFPFDPYNTVYPPLNNGSFAPHGAPGSEWDDSVAPTTTTRDHDYDGTNSIGKSSKRSKMRSRLFSFGGARKSRSSTSPPPPGVSGVNQAQSISPQIQQQRQMQPQAPMNGMDHYANPNGNGHHQGYAPPHEPALQAVVR